MKHAAILLRKRAISGDAWSPVQQANDAERIEAARIAECAAKFEENLLLARRERRG